MEEEKGIPSSRDHMHTNMGTEGLIGEMEGRAWPGDQGAGGQVRKAVERNLRREKRLDVRAKLWHVSEQMRYTGGKWILRILL